MIRALDWLLGRKLLLIPLGLALIVGWAALMGAVFDPPVSTVLSFAGGFVVGNLLAFSLFVE